MNKSIKRALIIVPSLALAGIFATGAVMADRKECRHGYGHEKMGHQEGMIGHRMAHNLDLTDAQKDAIKDIMQVQHQGTNDGHQAMAAQLSELAQLELGSDAYIAKAKSIGTMQGNAMAQRLITQADVEQKVQALLTTEQLKKYQERRAEMIEHRTERMEKCNKKHNE